MGNLPNSRSYTLGNNDPVPSPLLDELQDAIIGGWRGSYFGRPTTMLLGQTGFTQQNLQLLSGSSIGGPIWTSGATLAAARYQMNTDENDTIGGVALDVFGTAQPISVICVVGSATQLDSGSGFATLCVETFTPAAGWNRVVWLPAASHAFIARRMTNTDIMLFDVQVNNHVGIKLAGVRPVLSRQP